ncbi:hypothetical protein KIN20_030543 [Parelaphostrongylus tenuis]|uniref:Uncharacterized protein n=1 Tax=Parelaphostrongylus tenuis TaxID=148309 RepID=A0AAD5WGG7_PARTN|nr:hypothetical protein KIN20_030542 [Parelaphostrongylus tenuis]KAJ1369141.1 hypothetical protein KIN20_030543 [Parelaphostrongylus tenuis]
MEESRFRARTNEFVELTHSILSAASSNDPFSIGTPIDVNTNTRPADDTSAEPTAANVAVKL